MPFVSDQDYISSNNRGPITSLFVQPPSCTATFTAEQGGDFIYVGHWGADYFDPACVPWGTRSRIDIVTGDWGAYYYSPAICPQGWNGVTTFTSYTSLWGSPDYWTLGSDTTAALCCPTSYSYFKDGHVCSSTLTIGRSYKYIRPVSDGISWSTGSVKENNIIKETSIVADGIPIWWQSSDASALSRAATMTPSTLISTQSPTSAQVSSLRTAASTSTSTSTSDPESGGLSTNGKIGIGVGIPLAVIAALIVGFFVWKHRKTRAIQTSDPKDQEYSADEYISKPPAQNSEALH